MYTQRPPSPTTAVQITLKQPAKRTFIICRQEVNFERESIPGGGTNNGECATLPSCSRSMSMRHQYSWPVTEERRTRRPGRPDTGLQSSQKQAGALPRRHRQTNYIMIPRHSHYIIDIFHFFVVSIFLALSEGARWSSGIDAAIGARGRGSRPVYYLTVQRPWTSR